MSDQLIAAIITAFLGTLPLIYQAFNKNKHDNFNDDEKRLSDYKEDAELYRERWKKAEENNEQLRQELEAVEKDKKGAKDEHDS